MTTRLDPSRVVRAPRGPQRSCRSWLTEAAYRMIQNNLDPEVAEHPQALVVYGGIGRAARDWESFDAILATLRRLEEPDLVVALVGVARLRLVDVPDQQARTRKRLVESGLLPVFNKEVFSRACCPCKNFIDVGCCGCLGNRFIHKGPCHLRGRDPP